jgi:hypothetical protein
MGRESNMQRSKIERRENRAYQTLTAAAVAVISANVCSIPPRSCEPTFIPSPPEAASVISIVCGTSRRHSLILVPYSHPPTSWSGLTSNKRESLGMHKLVGV